MNKIRLSKLIVYVILLQVLLTLFALLIEKIIELTVKQFNVSIKMEILIIFSILIFGLLMLYVIYRQIYSLLVFEPLSSSIFSETEKKSFWILLNKIKNREVLNSDEKIELQQYIDKSPLPTDFVSTYSTNLRLTKWNKIVLVITLIVLSILISNKRNEPNPNNKPVS